MSESVFSSGKWIWSEARRENHYALFVKTIALPPLAGLGAEDEGTLSVCITASYHYELFINGEFVRRGPVHGDPQWCQVDAFRLPLDPGLSELRVAVVVHHDGGTHLNYLLPAPPGLLAEFDAGDVVVGTDESWRCLDLEMWRDGVAERGWALGYCEDYDARLEPPGWQEKDFPPDVTNGWPNAVAVEDADRTWGGYTRRMVPYLERELVEPLTFQGWRASEAGAADVADVSLACDDEPLEPVGGKTTHCAGAVNAVLDETNALTFDLGREHVGFYSFEIEAPAGVVIDVSGAELLRGTRPWIFRKGCRYSMRYTTREGRQQFTSFGWNGFRYLHVVIRGGTRDVWFHHVGCVQRKAPLTCAGAFEPGDVLLARIFELCRYTLEVGVQEHLVDCPTREQTQYWGDGLFIAESLWAGFDEPAYLKWYLDSFLHMPFKPDGQIGAQYPSGGSVLVDYSLIPLLGQRMYKAHTGEYYKPEETVEKALKLKQWYDARLGERGLVEFDDAAGTREGCRNFIDHPGIGWHNFPHRGIDRQGSSCPLNTFFYGFVSVLSELTAELDRPDAAALAAQAKGLAAAIRREFFDGAVFHDANDGGVLSEGTSWQTNGLAVYFGLAQGEQARLILGAMLSGYDHLCRCSPYFHFYFLPALRLAGLEDEARELIKREWGPMLERDATTTWEGFLGDEKDSLCHPWSTAPFLFLLEVDT